MIKLLRVDHRLVHGQVAISWTRALGVDCILVANDAVVADPMRQSMIRMSKPQGVKIVIKSIEDSIKAINSGVTDKYKLLIVVNCVQDAERLLTGCLSIKEINLGVMPAKEGTKAISKAIHANQEDIGCMKRLLENNIKMIIQQVPTESETIVTNEILDK
ncbi:PTS sugar transporter subunit IIB [Irregularibacter muris]|uniref:PTS sugar transporter subunit IIB n=1 Tax=Irregularibacter muris TaxID=1796619 RepID=A0AAE3L2B9_9FIRM|nr:PTS sugar transporter subunit IIB [Irregularibacter muris]MCR1898244.1 PTS sugar transporter subunit IIB [Irregularibacter muris]